METIDKFIGISVLLVCMTWCGIKVFEFSSRAVTPSQQIIQPKQIETKDISKPIEAVTPWVSELVNLSVTSPDKFKSDGNLWIYNETELWIANGIKYVELFNRSEIKLTELEKTTLYNAFVNWNKRYSEEAKLNYKID